MQKSFEERLREVVLRDGRYSIEAYRFIYEALGYTLKAIGREGHVTGRELLEGIRGYASEHFGGLAPMVFENWGVARTIDFGNIVFNLVEAGLMGKNPTDSVEDFADVYDFRKTFRVDLHPAGKAKH